MLLSQGREGKALAGVKGGFPVGPILRSLPANSVKLLKHPADLLLPGDLLPAVQHFGSQGEVQQVGRQQALINQREVGSGV